MIRGILASLLGVVLVFTVACKSKPDDREAIKAGVIKHLVAVQGLNVPNMEVTVTQFSITGNQANAQVEIRAKSGDNSGGTMNLSYNLEKRGDDWVVLKGPLPVELCNIRRLAKGPRALCLQGIRAQAARLPARSIPISAKS